VTNSVKPKRISASSAPGVGAARFNLLWKTAERIAMANSAGYYLEATTLIESLVADRLEKRVQFLLADHAEAESKKVFREARKGFAELGTLTKLLSTLEKDEALRASLVVIDEWRRGRNKVIHQMAKLGDTVRDTWDERLANARKVAARGISVLCEVDLVDRRLSHDGRGVQFASATCPNALEPLGQAPCDWCAPGSAARARSTVRPRR